MSLNANFHTHTKFCDGSDAAEDMVKEAIRLGFTTLGFSGHMDPDVHMEKDKYFVELDRLKAKYGSEIEILSGIELDTMYPVEEGAGAEYIIGSTHFMDVPMIDGEYLSVDSTYENLKKTADYYFGGDFYKMSKAYYELEATVYDKLKCTFVGHFDLITRFNDDKHFLDEQDPRYYKPALEAMEYLVKEGVPFEINCGAVNRGRKADFYPNHMLLSALHDMGGEILINTDAHQKEKLQAGFKEAAEDAISCGFKHVNVLTKRGGGKLHFEQLALDTLY